MIKVARRMQCGADLTRLVWKKKGVNCESRVLLTFILLGLMGLVGQSGGFALKNVRSYRSDGLFDHLFR